MRHRRVQMRQSIGADERRTRDPRLGASRRVPLSHSHPSVPQKRPSRDGGCSTDWGIPNPSVRTICPLVRWHRWISTCGRPSQAVSTCCRVGPDLKRLTTGDRAVSVAIDQVLPRGLYGDSEVGQVDRRAILSGRSCSAREGGPRYDNRVTSRGHARSRSAANQEAHAQLGRHRRLGDNGPRGEVLADSRRVDCCSPSRRYSPLSPGESCLSESEPRIACVARFPRLARVAFLAFLPLVSLIRRVGVNRWSMTQP